MALINEDYLKLPDNYLFTEIARKINILKATRGNAKVIHLDAGDTSCILRGEIYNTLKKSLEESVEWEGSREFNAEEHHKTLVTRILKNEE